MGLPTRVWPALRLLARAEPTAAAALCRWLDADLTSSGTAATRCSSRQRDSRAPPWARTFSTAPPQSPAFVFDIDGVLIRGGTVLPAAKRALARLYSADAQQPRYPVCFLTNGGGVTEAHKAAELSDWLGVNIGADQVVLSHTPYRQLTHLKDKPVLLAGLGSLKEVAADYGFREVTTTDELDAALPHAAPFSVATISGRQPDSVPVLAPGDPGTAENPFAAVLLLKDPTDWFRDLQLILDVVMSKGAPGRAEPPPNAPDVPVYFSNPDMLWANEFPVPRLGQGAFAACLEMLHQEVTGMPMQAAVYYGKPNLEPYRLMEALLRGQAARLGHDRPAAARVHSRAELEASEKQQLGPLPFSSIFAVGDNPAADVRGANRAGPPWVSVLVRTGVFSGPSGSNSTKDPAQVWTRIRAKIKMVVEDVEEAVEAALHRARAVKWHSMR